MEWLSLSKTLADLGFVGVAGWLLVERFWHSKESYRRDEKLSNALQNLAVATSRLTDSVKHHSNDIRDFKQEIRVELSRGK